MSFPRKMLPDCGSATILSRRMASFRFSGIGRIATGIRAGSASLSLTVAIRRGALKGTGAVAAWPASVAALRFLPRQRIRLPIYTYVACAVSNFPFMQYNRGAGVSVRKRLPPHSSLRFCGQLWAIAVIRSLLRRISLGKSAQRLEELPAALDQSEEAIARGCVLLLRTRL